VLDAAGRVAHRRRLDVTGVARWLGELGPRVIGIDSPREPAPDGAPSRPGERAFAAAGVCGIRFTPDRATLQAPHPTGYYDWILHGMELYAALAGHRVVEVFPTATWTLLHGPRGRRSRAAWTCEALERAGVDGLPRRTSQDLRDAIAAAVTARMCDEGHTRVLGGIAIPRAE
jgi:predicted nuclease with RNAse H fold